MCKADYQRWRNLPEAREELGHPSQTPCSVEGCSKPSYRRGMCRTHYRPSHGLPCSIDGCTDVRTTKGLCTKHYDASREPCNLDECGRPALARGGLCSMHYRRKQRNGHPLALQNHRASNRYEPRGDGTARLYLPSADTVILDDGDVEFASRYNWWVSPRGYVCSGSRQSERRAKTVFLHRLLVGLGDGDPRVTDHISGDKLDNRRANLRITSNQRNVAHQLVVNNRGTSRFRNVYWDPGSQRWIASVRIQYRNYVLGRFGSEEEAAETAAVFRAERDLPSGY